MEAKARQRGEEAVAAAEHAKRATHRVKELEHLLNNARSGGSGSGGGGSGGGGGGGSGGSSGGGMGSPFPDYRPLSPPESDGRRLTRS